MKKYKILFTIIVSFYCTTCISQDYDTVKYFLSDKQIRRIKNKESVTIKSKFWISKHKLKQEDYCIIEGVLLDRLSRKPIRTANVYVSYENGTATDENGFFCLKVKEGKHTVKFQCIGYPDFKIERIKINKSEKIKVVLFYGAAWIK